MSEATLFDTGEFLQRLEFPTDELAEQRILDAYSNATDAEYAAGNAWYFDAHDLCASWMRQYKANSTSHVAGIVASLSPMKTWQGNIETAQELLETGECRGLSYAVKDARAIYEGTHPEDVLFVPGRNNTKVRSFYQNINDPDDPQHVTIDRHMIGLLADNHRALNIQRWILPKQHIWAAERFQAVAKDVGLVPNQVQAITWLVWRRQNGIVESESIDTQQTLFAEESAA